MGVDDDLLEVIWLNQPHGIDRLIVYEPTRFAAYNLSQQDDIVAALPFLFNSTSLVAGNRRRERPNIILYSFMAGGAPSSRTSRSPISKPSHHAA
jgi:hypothetical protein